jgi:hypothetical protein
MLQLRGHPDLAQEPLPVTLQLVEDLDRLRAGPDTDPLETPQVPWPPEISERFDSCFNEGGEVRPDES